MRRTTLVLIAVLLAGCATPADPEAFTRPDRVRLGDGNEAVDRGETTVEGNRVEVVMAEFSFEPTIIRAPGGATLTITLVNAGANVHNFEAPDREIDLTLAERERQVVTLTVPDVGAVQFQCKFHLPEAMRGEVRAT